MARRNNNYRIIHIYCRKCNALLQTFTQNNENEWMQETYKCKKCVRAVRLKKWQNNDILQNRPDNTYYI